VCEKFGGFFAGQLNMHVTGFRRVALPPWQVPWIECQIVWESTIRVSHVSTNYKGMQHMKRHREKVANYSRSRPAMIVQNQDNLPLHEIEHPLLPQSEWMSMQEACNDNIHVSSNDKSTTPSMYEPWKRTIASNGSNSHLWTLSFIHPYSDEAAIRGLAQWSKFVNRKIFGPRWKKQGNCIEGVVVAERHVISKDVRGRLHFHMLIKEHDTLSQHSDLARIFEESALRLTDVSGRKMTDFKRVNTRSITEQSGIIDYLVKDLITVDWKAGDNIMFLGSDGVSGVVLPVKGNWELIRRH
jgi:hypothetical protein